MGLFILMPSRLSAGSTYSQAVSKYLYAVMVPESNSRRKHFKLLPAFKSQESLAEPESFKIISVSGLRESANAV